MQIKSYFDSSIQTAMRQARHEFGDDVLLVTSRIASPEFRYLGDFEVVFAVDEDEAEPKAATPPQPEPPDTAFGEMFRTACAVPPAGDARYAAIVRVRALLADMGLEPAIAEALIGLIRSCVSAVESAVVEHADSLAVPNSTPPQYQGFEVHRQSRVALHVNAALTRQTDDVLRKVLALSAFDEVAQVTAAESRLEGRVHPISLAASGGPGASKEHAQVRPPGTAERVVPLFSGAASGGPCASVESSGGQVRSA